MIVCKPVNNAWITISKTVICSPWR